MPRLLCLAQVHAAAKQPGQPASGSGKKAARPAAKTAAKPGSFTVLEQVPVRLAAHAGVWAALRKHATRQPIIDTAHPQEAFPAWVIAVDRLAGDAVAAIAEVLAERRALVLAAEKECAASDILAARLDRLFEQEMEWLALRNLLAAALAPAPAARSWKRRRPKPRALLLIDA